MRHTLAVLLLCSVAWPPASAEPLPADGFPLYDVDGRCRAAYKGSEGICIDAEQQDYDVSRLFWDGLTAGQQAKCAAHVRTPGPRRYAALRGCVELESGLNDLGRRQSTTKFRY